MLVEKFESEKNQKLSEFLLSKNLSYGTVQKLLRNKDVKINGKRVSKDTEIFAGDEIAFYLSESQVKKIDIIFEDENILVANKPRGIETTSLESKVETLEIQLKKQIGKKIFPVHRLDRNTSGLVVFAKNQNAKMALERAFKNRTIEKFYLALVYGTFQTQGDAIVAYLKKDSKNSVVLISNAPQKGYEKIITKYKVLDSFENSSLLEVELVTGKTHQIRAHLSHIGHFVIGDEKYGDTKINKIFKKHFQCLSAYKIKFHFEKEDRLFYLNEKTIELDKNKIDFVKK